MALRIIKAKELKAQFEKGEVYYKPAGTLGEHHLRILATYPDGTVTIKGNKDNYEVSSKDKFFYDCGSIAHGKKIKKIQLHRKLTWLKFEILGTINEEERLGERLAKNIENFPKCMTSKEEDYYYGHPAQKSLIDGIMQCIDKRKKRKEQALEVARELIKCDSLILELFKERNETIENELDDFIEGFGSLLNC